MTSVVLGIASLVHVVALLQRTAYVASNLLSMQFVRALPGDRAARGSDGVAQPMTSVSQPGECIGGLCW
jgi:hypothetical protein